MELDRRDCARHHEIGQHGRTSRSHREMQRRFWTKEWAKILALHWPHNLTTTSAVVSTNTMLLHGFARCGEVLASAKRRPSQASRTTAASNRGLTPKTYCRASPVWYRRERPAVQRRDVLLALGLDVSTRSTGFCVMDVQGEYYGSTPGSSGPDSLMWRARMCARLSLPPCLFVNRCERCGVGLHHSAGGP